MGRQQQFAAQVVACPGGGGLIVVPFDPDLEWGTKAFHLVGGMINGKRVRGSIRSGDEGWAFVLSPTWMRDADLDAGDHITAALAPEGPQRADLAGDVAAALAASPAAAEFFDTLAQFYRKAYLRWIDATTRRPELRAERIAEMVTLLAAGVKQRPRAAGG